MWYWWTIIMWKAEHKSTVKILNLFVVRKNQPFSKWGYKIEMYEIKYNIIAPMMAAVRISETSVYFETTWRYIPESYLHTHRRENLKCQI
jgi:hypothetical protein